MDYLCILLQVGAGDTADFAEKGIKECGIIFAGLLVVIAALLIGVRILWTKIETNDKAHNKIINDYRNEINQYHDNREQERQALFATFEEMRTRD